jgi:hypothetical protein
MRYGRVDYTYNKRNIVERKGIFCVLSVGSGRLPSLLYFRVVL